MNDRIKWTIRIFDNAFHRYCWTARIDGQKFEVRGTVDFETDKAAQTAAEQTLEFIGWNKDPDKKEKP